MRDSVPKAVALTAAATLLWQGATGILYLGIPTWLISHFARGEGGPELLEIGVRMLMVSSAWQLSMRSPRHWPSHCGLRETRRSR